MADRVHLRIPLDASEIPDFKADQKVKVVARDAKGGLHSRVVELDPRGQGVAIFEFEESPGALSVALGPENADDEDLFGMQTLALDVSARELAAGRELKLAPVRITPFYWHWWRRWCRTFVIRGRVVCPDNRPAPGALVCAYDVDFFWWWSSHQKVGCATTGADGTFQIAFTWCCGFLPWWWWRKRYWRLEPILAERILPVLKREPGLRGLPIPSPKPDLSVFEHLLRAEGGIVPPRPVGPPRGRPVVGPNRLDLRPRPGQLDPTTLGDLRERLVRHLPAVPALERLRLWPWFPWQPWFDCSPDIVFRVTQDCPEPGTVILDEGPWEARWDVPTQLDVTLAADKGCCLHEDPDPQGSCIVLSSVCGVPIERIGGNYGNVGSTPAQLGYANPGVVDAFGDRPFAGRVDLYGQLGDAACDYYELEWFDDDLADWRALPDGSVAGFDRRFHGPWTAGSTDPLSPFHWVPFPVQEIDGRQVIESRQHFEATHSPGTWGSTLDRRWTEINHDLLAHWITRELFANGTYRLRVVGWNLDAAGHLVNRRVLPVCEEAPPLDNEVVVTIDNRFEVDSGHPTAADHPCGSGTVHTCTTEPDTDVISVKILHDGGGETAVGPCGTVPISTTDRLQVDFLAHDPAGHLACYTLGATYRENLVRWLVLPACPAGGISCGPDLLGTVPGATLESLPLGSPRGPQYGHANPTRSALAQGATSPKWYGGTYRLTIRARDVFPETCCYQLELAAYKRTIVDCSSLHANQSHYTFMVVVP